MSTTPPTTSLMHKVLRPLVKLLLRNGVAFADFSDVARRVFVEVANDDFALPGKKQSVSRVSVLTGVNRKEVKRLLESSEKDLAQKENNRAARVVSGWMRDKEFSAKNKAKPLILGDGDKKGSFESLVKKYSGDMTARAVLDELVRVGAVKLNKNKDSVKLLSNGYVPSNSNDELLRISADSIHDLLSTIEHNLNDEYTDPRLQLKVSYDDVPLNGVELFRNLSREKSLELLNYLDEFLATQDRSGNPKIKGEGKFRTGLGIYYFEETMEDASDE